MATILILAGEFPSLREPAVELGRRLAAAGYTVTLAAEPETRGVAEDLGLRFLALEPSDYESWLTEDAREGLWARLRRLSVRRRQALASLRLDGWIAAVGELGPDLLLADVERHEHLLALAPLGVPTVLHNSFCSIWRRPGLPPPHQGVRPGVGFWGRRWPMALLWMVLRLHKIRAAGVLWLRHAGCDRRSLLHRLARRGGVDLGREADAGQWLIPFTYRHLPVLSLHALELEFPHPPPPRVRYVGPMLPPVAPAGPVDEAGHRLEEVLARRRTEPEARLVYAAFGSTLTAGSDLLRRLVAALENRPGWELLLSLGGRGEAASDLPASPRLHTFSWVDQRRVLEHADVCVTHGGIHTVDECVAAGVPMLIYPGGETDMAGNAARVAHHGVGLVGDPRRDSAAKIEGYVNRLLGEPAFRRRLAALQRSLRRYVEERVLERTVEEILQGEGPLRPGWGSSR